MRNRVFELWTYALVLSGHAVGAEDSKPVNLIEQKTLLFEREFTRDPMLAQLSFGSMLLSLQMLGEGSPPYPGKADLRKNTPWGPDQWASFITQDTLRNPERIAEYGSSRYLSNKNNSFAFLSARTVLLSSFAFLASPARQDSNSTNAAYLDPEVIWSLCRTGDMLSFDTLSADGDQHVVRLHQIDHTTNTAEIVDMWPNRFIFKDGETQKMGNGAPIVVVSKKEFLVNLKYVTFFEERAFPVLLSQAANGKMDAADLAAMGCAFALQLARGGQLADLDSALAVIELTEAEDGANLDEKIKSRTRFAKAYCHLLRRAIVGEILTGGSLSDRPTREQFILRSRQDNAFLEQNRFKELLQAATPGQLVALGDAHLEFDPVAAMDFFEMIVRRDGQSIENLEALAGSAICALLLGDLAKAKEAAEKASVGLAKEQTNYEDAMKANGLQALLGDGDKRQSIQIFSSVRPDLEMRRARIESATGRLQRVTKMLASPGTRIRWGE